MKPTHSCHQVFCIVGSRREKKGKLFCCISVVAVVVSQSSNKIIIVNIIIKISITSRQRWPHLSWRWCSKNTNSNVANCPCALAKLFTLIISKLLAAHLLWSLSSVGLAHWCAQNYQSVPSVEQVAITNSLRSTTWGCRGWTVMGLTPPSAPHRFHLSKHVPAAAKTQSFHLTLSPYPPPPPPHLSSLFSLDSLRVQIFLSQNIGNTIKDQNWWFFFFGNMKQLFSNLWGFKTWPSENWPAVNSPLKSVD